MERRRFLAGTAAVVGGGALVGAAGAASAQVREGRARVVERPPSTGGGHYLPNRDPLRPAAFLRLPVGSVVPGGWLRQQLELELGGITGRMPEISDYLVYETNGWVDPSQPAWEELPYWLRGFIDLGYVTGHADTIERAHKWVDGILGTQDADGFFGPTRLRTALEGGPDLWPHMPLLDVFRSFHDHTGDARIVPFLTSFFGFQNEQPVEVFGRGWGAFRWGDTIDTVYWLYNQTGESSLLDLVRKIHQGSADYVSGIPNWHNVNLAQGFREPAQYWVLDGDQSFRDATYRNHRTVFDAYGQFPGGGFAGDENSRPGYGDPRQGFETCGIVELIHSYEILHRITGDSVWMDRCEELAFNLLPAALDPTHRGLHYITCANSVQLDRTVLTRGQFQNDFPLLAYLPGVHNEPVSYRCCPHNYGKGWPYYSEELWQATPDAGLCAAMYAESEVTAKVGAGDGVDVTIAERTEYPFGETVRFTVSTGGTARVAFPFYLRVPGWCEGATVRLNGEPVGIDPTPGSYAVVDRTWSDGDVVELRLPMRTGVRTWNANQGSVSVDHGPLTFSLAIDERWESQPGEEPWPALLVFPESDWNYGLDLPTDDPASALELRRLDPPADTNPFTHEGARFELSAPGRAIQAWRTDPEQVIRTLQPSPVASDAPVERLRLLPMGATRLRITAFPRIGSGPDARPWDGTLATASWCWRGDSVDAVNDGHRPASSDDHTIPRLTWWDHVGTDEWVELAYDTPVTLSSSAVYWFDDTGVGQCRVPASWRLLYRVDGDWVEVANPSGYGTKRDTYNEVGFDEVSTDGLRLEVRLQDGFSGGILEWRG